LKIADPSAVLLPPIATWIGRIFASSSQSPSPWSILLGLDWPVNNENGVRNHYSLLSSEPVPS
jgi:hypothetical protein